MSDAPVKNRDRVPWLSQQLDPVGSVVGTRGVSFTKRSSVVAGELPAEETIVSDVQTIQQDGTYADPEGSRFQFRKGHPLAPDQLKRLKRVGDYPELQRPGATEFAQTIETAPKPETAAERKVREKREADEAKAAQEAENKQNPNPENK